MTERDAYARRVDYPDGDYTVVLGHIIPVTTVDTVEVDYSFLDDAPARSTRPGDDRRLPGDRRPTLASEAGR